MQCGVFNLPNLKREHHITFPMRYDRSPEILVWLKGLHLLPFRDRSFFLSLGQCGDTGFTVRAESLSSAIQSLEISWLAFPERGGYDVQIGTFHSSQNWKAGSTTLYRDWEGYLKFGTAFKILPKVAVGITAFSIDKSVDLSLAVKVVQVTCVGMKWRIDGGTNGHFWSASCSYIAFE